MDDTTSILVEDASEAQRSFDPLDALLEEVYIAPIRSVLVVDDEFPSLDGLLESKRPVDEGESARAIELLQGILSYCRTRKDPWLVDVHDARRIKWAAEEAIATHLHHSDLMILDYHLQGEAGGGDAAISVLRKLTESTHFNLVVVYTKGYKEDIRGVFYELVSAFASKNFNSTLSGADLVGMGPLVDELVDGAGIEVNDLDEYLTQEMYLKLRYSRLGSAIPGSPETALQGIFKNHAVKGLNVKSVLEWLMVRAHERYRNKLGMESAGRMTFDYGDNGAANWIRFDSLFITVVNKQYDPSDIESSLLAALKNSDPAPHQLMMAKMRAQMDNQGAIAESEILNDLHMQAGWLQELLNTPEEDRSSVIKKSVDKHWEALGDKLRVDVDRFSQGILGQLVGDPKLLLRRYFGTYAKNGEEILARLNVYNNSKPVQGPHLMTGHVLRLENGEGRTYWVCLSPACDLVPGQRENGWRIRLGNFMPFVAVRLDDNVVLGTALKKASENVNVFLMLDGKIKALSFCPEGNPNSSPVWEQMFAARGGQFDPARLTLGVTRMLVPADKPAPQGDEIVHDAPKGISTEVSEVTVVAQLRYEYALNLLQRLGTSLSRVGLDFHKA